LDIPQIAIYFRHVTEIKVHGWVVLVPNKARFRVPKRTVRAKLRRPLPMPPRKPRCRPNSNRPTRCHPHRGVRRHRRQFRFSHAVMDPVRTALALRRRIGHEATVRFHEALGRTIDHPDFDPSAE
jgi:hypothetical protein